MRRVEVWNYGELEFKGWFHCISNGFAIIETDDGWLRSAVIGSVKFVDINR